VKWIAVTFLLAFSSLLFAEQRSDSPPLVVSNVAPDRSAKWLTVTFDLTNVSGNPIRAYVLAISYDADNGRPSPAEMQYEIRGMGPGGPDSIRPGETIHGDVNVPIASSRPIQGGSDTKPPNVDSHPDVVKGISVDYVLFADGSKWGPDTRKESEKIAGVLEGHDVTVFALKHMLQTQGVDAVIEYLENARPAMAFNQASGRQ
jgi:hypothetical protein